MTISISWKDSLKPQFKTGEIASESGILQYR